MVMKKLLRIATLMGGLGLKASVTFLVLGLATGTAHLEHQARLGLGQDEAAASRAMPAGQTEKPRAMALSTGLAPNLFLLDQVKEQAFQKPLFDKKSSAYDKMIEDAARTHRISPALVKAVIQAESKFDDRAVSSQGAVGLMQILPSTARSMGVSSPQEPRNNITAGVRYLKMLLEEFGDDEYLALAAYNCGPEAIKRYGGKMPPFSETRSFVSQVMRYYQSHIES
jgi:soluble lytic murein transglycosylase-like protein